MEYGDNTPVTQDDFPVLREYRLHISVDELATEYTLGGQFLKDNELSLQTKLSDLHTQYDNPLLAELSPTGTSDATFRFACQTATLPIFREDCLTNEVLSGTRVKYRPHWRLNYSGNAHCGGDFIITRCKRIYRLHWSNILYPRGPNAMIGGRIRIYV
jgi:hypothetical protein